LRRKANPFSNISSRGSRREAQCSPRTARAIVISYVPEKFVVSLSLSLSFSLSLLKEKEALMFCPLQNSRKRATLALGIRVYCMHDLSRISIRALLATLKQSIVEEE